MTQMLQRFMNDESGVTAIEYGLLAAATAAGVAIGIPAMRRVHSMATPH